MEWFGGWRGEKKCDGDGMTFENGSGEGKGEEALRAEAENAKKKKKAQASIAHKTKPHIT
jgi:hypothetical protein